MNLDDLGILLSVSVENIQFLTLGPSFLKYNRLLWELGLVISMNLEEMYGWEYNSYWYGYKVYLALASSCILVIILYYF